MPTKEKNEVRMVGVLPSQGADPIPVRLVTEAPGGGMIEKNEVRMVGILPAQGADPIPVSIEFPSNMCRIKTGTYTGDGTESYAITGVGFRPKYVKIWFHITGEGQAYSIEKLDQSWGGFAYTMYPPTYINWSFDNKIISLDVDGFTVDDGGGDNFPNSWGGVYDYLALG